MTVTVTPVIPFIPRDLWWKTPHLHAKISPRHCHPTRFNPKRYRRMPDGSIRLVAVLAAVKAGRKTRTQRRQLKALRRVGKVTS